MFHMKRMKTENTTPHIKLGQIGEDIVVKHLMKHKFQILDKNYRKKWGEIDIIAKKDGILHFIEVKTVSCETSFNEHLPEENIHYFKKKRLARAVQTYLAEKKVFTMPDSVSCETPFKIQAIIVFFDPYTKKSRMREIENIIL